MNRRGIIKFIGFSLIIMVILVVVLRVAMTAKSVISRKLEDQRIRALTYPEPSEKVRDYLTFKEHMGGTNIHSKWIGFGPITDQDGNELGMLLISVSTRIEGKIRAEISEYVSMKIESTGNLRLPIRNWRQAPLILTSDQSIEIQTDQYAMDLASMFKEEGHRDAMGFLVPTTLFVNAVKGEILTVRVGNLEVEVTEEYLDAFRDLAAYLKPGVSP